ncbi:MAG TPA: hypothetical protein VNY52_11855 [Solirubrobacteraceae bacterium]|jgi:hypothetical protein|nr:hypothetical protein [Solirubrobacteraceae bacterium]
MGARELLVAVRVLMELSPRWYGEESGVLVLFDVAIAGWVG